MGLAFLLTLAAAAPVASREVPFWPDTVPAAIQRNVDGIAALETVRALGRFHRVHGSPGMAAAAAFVRQKLEDAGVADATVEHFPADGETRYAHFRSYLGWTPVEAELDEVEPTPGTVKRFPDLPVALADYSQDADVTAELVDVGAGTSPSDYAGKDVAGKIVLASGPLPMVHGLCCEERKGVGFLSDFPNQTTAWSGDDKDLVRWGHLSPYKTQNTFAFMLSRRESEAYRARLAKGEHPRLRAHVRARMVPASYDVVVATIPGTDRASEEVLLTAHLCHESVGANDNASGSAAILEVARSLQSAVRRGDLPKPRRTLRFLFLPEIAGSQAYLVSHPEVAHRAIGAVHMDMVGGTLQATHGTFHLSTTAASLPHAVNAVAAAFLEQVQRVSGEYAEHGGDPRHGLVWLPGSREWFLADLRPLEMGSDHEVLQESSFAVPTVYFHDWPDTTIHTNKDLPENLDSTKLGRVAYLGAGIAWTLAALPDEEAGHLLSVTRADCLRNLASAQMRAELSTDPREAAVVRRGALLAASQELRSLARIAPEGAAMAISSAEEKAREAAAIVVPRLKSRIPSRSPDVRGPLDVYYYSHLTEVLGPDSDTEPALVKRRGGVLAYEALNLVDGRRSVQDICDYLEASYGEVPLGEVEGYLDLLARAKVVRWLAGGAQPTKGN